MSALVNNAAQWWQTLTTGPATIMLTCTAIRPAGLIRSVADRSGQAITFLFQWQAVRVKQS